MSFGSQLSSLLRTAVRSPAVRRAARSLGRSAVRAVQEQQRGGSGSARRGTASPGPAASSDGAAALPDRTSAAPVAISYAPRADDDADPGEIAWAWVPFEEDITQGKDRPVLVLAREDGQHGDVLIALMLTSRDRGEAVHVDEHGSTWVDIGSGSWDSQGRPSEVRADRLLQIRPDAVRREGAKLPEDRFEKVARVVREVHGWA